MVKVRLRPVSSVDIPLLSSRDPDDDPFGFYGFTATNVLERRFAADGLISDDMGTLIVEDDHRSVAGVVSWSAAQHGPSRTARALNVGIRLLPQHRGHGLGTAAQAALADYHSTTPSSNASKPEQTQTTSPSSGSSKELASDERGSPATPSTGLDAGATSSCTAAYAAITPRRKGEPTQTLASSRCGRAPKIARVS